MPGAPLGNRHARGEHSVSATPLVARRKSNDRRADQRVPEGESPGRLVDLDDACSFGRREVVEPRSPGAAASSTRRSPVPSRTAINSKSIVGSGSVPNPGREQVLEPRSQREDVRQMTSRRVGISKCDGQLEQRQRVALRVGHQPLAHVRRQRWEPLLEQGRRGRFVERLELVAGQSSTIEEALGFGPQRRQETDAGTGEATHGRSKHQRTRSVQPRQIIDHHQQGASHRGVAKKSENCVRHHQSVRRRPGIQTKRDAQRLTMQRRQPPQGRRGADAEHG